MQFVVCRAHTVDTTLALVAVYPTHLLFLSDDDGGARVHQVDGLTSTAAALPHSRMLLAALLH